MQFCIISGVIWLLNGFVSNLLATEYPNLLSSELRVKVRVGWVSYFLIFFFFCMHH